MIILIFTYIVMRPITLQLLCLWLFARLAGSQLTCSAHCDISYSGTNNVLGCFDQTPTGCTSCYSELFYLSGSSCLLRTQQTFIYNSTSSIPFGSWTLDPADSIESANYSNMTYEKFSTVGTMALNYTIPSTHAHYGIRFRFWVYFESPWDNQMYFYVNGTLQQTTLEPSFPANSSNTWIVTTDFLNYTDSAVTLSFLRTDNASYIYYTANSSATNYSANTANSSATNSSVNSTANTSNTNSSITNSSINSTTNSSINSTTNTSMNSTTNSSNSSINSTSNSTASNYSTNSTTPTANVSNNLSVNYYVYSTGVDDLFIIVAECVVGCTSCTSLKDCRACAAGYYLNNQTHLCMTDCGPSMYESGSLCLPCAPQCQTCNTWSTHCQSCTDQEPNEAFLYGSNCYDNCPYHYHENYETHRCECGAGYFIYSSNCYACHPYCLTCFAGSNSQCYSCSEGYYRQHGTHTCSIYCPTGQYYRPGVQIRDCYLCDASCFSCQNSSTVCTSCLFPTNDKYLHNHQCLSLCPDGYQQNNNTFTCDECPAETFSHQQVCISECPEHYSESEGLKACVLLEHRGYPLSLTLQADTTTLSLSTTLELGISAINKTQLETDFENRVTLTLITEESSTVQLVGATTASLTIDSLTIINNVLTLNTTAFTPTQLTPLHSFKVQFADNIYSADNVMYTISTIYSFSENPSDLRLLLSPNLVVIKFIVLPMIIIALLFLLPMVKYLFFGWLEYLHCIQLLGLTLYSLFPYSFDLDVYFFLVGVDFANFSYIPNIPLIFISPCTHCVSLSGYAFIQDDMDYFRSMGSVWELFLFICLLTLVLMKWRRTQQYGFLLLKLVVVLIMIKSLHAWFSSFIGSTFSYYTLASNGVGLLMLIIFIYQQYKWKQEHGYINVRVIGLFGYTLILTFISMAPLLLSWLIITWSSLEWILIHMFNVNEYGVPEFHDSSADHEEKSDAPDDAQPTSCQDLYHQELMRSFKPLMAFLVVSVILSPSQRTIILVSVVLGVELLLLIIDSILLYLLYGRNQNQVENQADQASQNINNIFEESLKPSEERIKEQSEKKQDSTHAVETKTFGRKFWQQKQNEKTDSRVNTDLKRRWRS